MDLKAIGDEMNRQDNRGTQYPLYVIQVDKKRWVDYGDEYDGTQRREEQEEAFLCDTCKELFKNGEVLPEECESCDYRSFDFYVLEKEFALNAGVFFTEKSCEEHIKQLVYHYDNPKSFVIGAWRNEEMQSVMQFLSGLGGAVVNFYR